MRTRILDWCHRYGYGLSIMRFKCYFIALNMNKQRLLIYLLRVWIMNVNGICFQLKNMMLYTLQVVSDWQCRVYYPRYYRGSLLLQLWVKLPSSYDRYGSALLYQGLVSYQSKFSNILRIGCFHLKGLLKFGNLKTFMFYLPISIFVIWIWKKPRAQ